MKRLRIWIGSFSLIQQFISVAILTVSFFVFFFFSYMNNNIDTFVNNQLISYLESSQKEMVIRQDAISDVYKDSDIVNFLYSRRYERFVSSIAGYGDVLTAIEVKEGSGAVKINDKNVVYSIVTYSDNYMLVSLVRNSYRNDFRKALLDGVMNITFVALIGLFFFFMLWVFSLLAPLQKIRTYIEKVRNGEQSELKISRHDEIGGVADAIIDMNNELSKQENIRREMIQNISHDLKTPIATIKSYGESIKDGIYPYDTLEKSCDVIIEHANRLEKKVYSLITFNKLGYLEDSDPNNYIAMAEVIEKAILSCQVLRNDITFETNIDESVYFHGEEEPWRVVVENLLDNALRYAKSRITITLEKNKLEVFNDGELMDKDRIEKLFKPYEKGTKGKFGLGLSIVKKVTETYGYNVAGENMSDGVVFRISLVKMPKQNRNRLDNENRD